MATLTVALAAVLAMAGCGGAKRYALDATRACLLKTDGVLVRAVPPSDFIAGSATRGAMNAKLAANQVTITFSENEEQARNVAKGYRRFRGKGIGIDSALDEVANVVMVWGITPKPADKTVIHSCLKG